MIFKHHQSLAFKDIKELTRAIVIMHHFHTTGWDAFLDHTHIVALEQMPAIANLSPDIVFCVFKGNYLNDLQRLLNP